MRKFLLYPLILLLLLGCLSACQTGSDPIVKFDGAIKKQIIDTINDSTVTIDMALYCLSDKDVINALKEVRQKTTVRLIIDPGYHRFIKGHGFKKLRLLGGRKSGGLMHNKFGIFDNKLVMTGSYNISDNAHNNSYENAIFLHNRKVIDEYHKQFERLWKKASPPGK